LFSITCKNNGFYLVHFNFRTGQLICDGKKYFGHEACTVIFKDREGRIWVGTADGLYKQTLHNSFFSVTDLSIQDSQMVNHDIRCIYMDEHSIFTGMMNEGGLLILDKNTGLIRNRLVFTSRESNSNSIVNIFPYSRDTLWIATRAGILWLNRNNLHYGKLKIPKELNWMQNISTRTFFEDSKKNIWISFATLNSLVRYNRNTQTFAEISTRENPLLKITFVISLAEDEQGNIWLAGDGLCRWNLQKQKVDTLIPYPKVSRLLLNYMYILDRDGGNNLWLSSYDNQIVQYNCTSQAMNLRQLENNNMDGNTVTSSPIIRNYIWMGTDNGISAFNISNYSVKQFTYADGLPSVAITTIGRGSFYDRSSNRFYLGAKHRLISFTPDVNLSRKLAPMLFIEKLTTRDSVIRSVSNVVRLKFSQNNLTIYFNTINYTDPEENRFSWRSLSGNDTGWNDITNQNSITLTNLEGGMNSVQVKLLSANNHWPQQVRTMFIYIQPPFWKSVWFIFLFATCVAALILIIYKTRVNNVRKKEREKARVQQLIAEEYKNQFELEQISNYFSSSLASIRNVDDVLWDVTKNLIGRMNYEDCIIYMWNADRTRMIQKAAYGPKGNPKTISAQAFDVEPGQGIVGHVMLTKESQLVCDTRKDPRYRVDDMNRLSELCVPIIHNDELIGVIDSEHHRMNHFKERDVKMLTTIATLVGNKIKQIESEQSLVKKQKEIAYVNQQLAEAQLSALQTQMNPHFIFNSLNSIKGMILENEQLKASRYLTRFAQMIRITLNQSKEVFTTLYENLEHLESYLVMEKLRFDDSFTYRVIVDECIDKEETLIPTLMIQPLVENAIWHGLMNNEGEKKILIHFSKLEETISCTIEDNGIGINRAEELKKLYRPSHNSVGLNNLRNRIQIMNEKYEIDCSLVITDLRDWNPNISGTCAVLRFNIITSKLNL
jgi:putative methionine-R-sulfoxide reductase with GAF domain